MAKFTKAEAARQLHISCTTLYKLIDQGKLSASPDGLIDTAELVRVLSTVNVHGERPLTPLDTAPLDTVPGFAIVIAQKWSLSNLRDAG